MHPFWIVELLIQIFFAAHAAMTGRYWWIFIILFFPIVGPMGYFFAEYLPERRMKSRMAFNPESRIEQLRKELKITDSVKKRQELAEAYFYASRFEEAIAILEKSLTGAHSDDTYIMEGLCLAHFNNKNYKKAAECLKKLEELGESRLKDPLRLIRARIFEETGEIDNALEEYRSLINVCVNEEARCRYALLLKKRGEIDKANEQFSEILKNAELHPKQYLRFEKRWVDIARAEIR